MDDSQEPQRYVEQPFCPVCEYYALTVDSTPDRRRDMPRRHPHQNVTCNGALVPGVTDFQTGEWGWVLAFVKSVSPHPVPYFQHCPHCTANLLLQVYRGRVGVTP